MSQIDLESRLAPGAAGLRRLAWLRGWRLVVLFGSMARDGMGRDLDLAVLPGSATPLLEQGRWQAELEELYAPLRIDLLLLGPDTSPVTRYEVFRDGRCLYEALPGTFDGEYDRAFFLYADSEWLRRQQREALVESAV